MREREMKKQGTKRKKKRKRERKREKERVRTFQEPFLVCIFALRAISYTYSLGTTSNLILAS